MIAPSKLSVAESSVFTLIWIRAQRAIAKSLQKSWEMSFSLSG